MKIIGIPKTLSLGKKRFLNSLGKGLGVRFEEELAGLSRNVDAWLLDGADQNALNFIGRSGCPCYTIVESGKLIPTGSPGAIEFVNHPVIPKVLSGKKIRPDKHVEVKALPDWLSNCTVLASKGEIPIWSVDERWKGAQHFVTFPIPEMEDDGSPAIYIHGGCILGLLPLIIFLKRLIEDSQWAHPPIRACFMFDDPNLHWRTYGYINFKKVLEHARAYGHHVSFATIPLDCWFAHKPTADLIRQNQDKLSILMHGNEHVYGELAQSCTSDERRAMLKQSLERVSNLERRYGVKVARVMAPPHGACSEAFIEEMRRMEFDAVCVSYGSLYYYNKGRKWIKNIGINSCEVVRGLTVLPRFRLSKECQANIMMAAVLNQPIIPVGHHDDLQDGLESLGEIAEFINSLGDVKWKDVGEIAKMHYSKKIESDALKIMMFSKRIEVIVPKGVKKIAVDCHWMDDIYHKEVRWRITGNGDEWKTIKEGEHFEVNGANQVEILYGSQRGKTAWRSEMRRMKLYPIFRRQMTESRDRLKPMLKRLQKRIFG